MDRAGWLWRLAVPAVIGLVGLALRLVYASEFTAHPLGQVAWVDEGAYWTRAVSIAAGAWLPERPFYQDPLYPYWLAGLMRLVGSEVARLRIASACLGALTPVVVYLAARRGLGQAEAVIAGLAAAVYGPMVFTDGLLEKENLGALVAASALFLTAWAADSRARSWRALLAGLAWGALALLRANALALAPLGIIWWALAASDAVSRARRVKRALLYVLGFASAIAPVTIINAVVSRPRELILTTWQAGANVYIGNGPDANGTYSAPEFVEANPAHEADDFAAEAERRAGRKLSHGEVSRFWLNEGLRRWRKAPRDSARLLIRKLGLVMHDTEIPDNQDPQLVAVVAAPALSWSVLSFGAILPLAAIGLCQRDAWRATFLGWLALSTAAGLATTALFFVVGRYRVPWTPGLILLAASGSMQLVRLGRSGKLWSIAWRVLLVGIPAAVLAWRPIPDPAPDRWGHAEIDLALAYLADGRLEPALDALDDARALGKGPTVRVDSLLSDGPVRERLAWLIRLRRERSLPATRPTPLDQARWLRQVPESRASARAILQDLERTQPQNAQLLREWGAWWLGETDDPTARSKAEAALAQAASGDASAAILLALLRSDAEPLRLLKLGRDDRRQERVRLALAIVTHRRLR